MPRRTILLLALALPFSMASKCRKKGDEEVVLDETPAPPEVRLQVVSIEPSVVEPGKGFRAVVYGSDFQDGARAWIGDTPIAQAQVRDENTLAISVPALDTGTYDVRVDNPDGASATLRAGLTVRSRPDPTAGLDCSLVRVHFDFDSSALTAEARRTLDEHLACFEQPGARIRIEGNTDERGTTDYNLALGQRRAEAIDRYLVGKGIPPSRLQAISYGEEKPLVRGHDEAAWAQNRRGDVKVTK